MIKQFEYWAVAWSLLALPVAAALVGLTMLTTSGVVAGRRMTVVMAALIPFLSVWFAVGALVVEWPIDAIEGHGLSAVFGEVPLVNGYRLAFSNGFDYGIVRPGAKGQERIARNEAGSDRARGITRIQIIDNYILGEALVERPEGDMSWFVIDMRKETYSHFASETEMNATAHALGIAPHLRPFLDVYSQYRRNAFDRVAPIMTYGFPCTLLFLLGWRIRRLRKSR